MIIFEIILSILFIVFGIYFIILGVAFIKDHWSYISKDFLGFYLTFMIGILLICVGMVVIMCPFKLFF